LIGISCRRREVDLVFAQATLSVENCISRSSFAVLPLRSWVTADVSVNAAMDAASLETDRMRELVFQTPAAIKPTVMP
jgi:hypothetical protein